MAAKITTIDRETCRILRDTINQTLSSVGSRLGVKITAGSASYDAQQATFKLECATLNSSGEPITKTTTDFTRNACLYGLEAGDLGRSFESAGENWTLVGLSPRSRKFPFLCRKERDGKTYKMSERVVKAGLCIPSGLADSGMLR